MLVRRAAHAVSLAALVLAAAPVAGAESLPEALAMAYNSNPTLQAERARVRAVDEDFVQARSAALPSLTAQASATTGDRETTAYDTGSMTYVTTESDIGGDAYSITAAQNIWRGGRTKAGMDAAYAGVEAAREALRGVEQDVLLLAVQAYMDVKRDTAIVAIRLNNVAVLNKQLQAARDRFEVGEITRTDVAQAQARLAGARAELAAAQSVLTASRSAYQRVIGQSPGELEEPPELPALPASFDAAVDAGLDANPDIQAARAADEAARAAVRDAKGALWPTVSVAATAAKNDTTRGFDPETESTTISGRVTFPLYSGGANSSRLRQAHEEASQARLQLRQAERLVREGVSNAWWMLDAARSRLASSAEQVNASEIAFEGVEEEARVGLRTTLDVLNAEQELLNARLALVSAERDEYVAGFQVLRAVGRLSAGELGLPVDIYAPEDNFKDVRGRFIGVGILESGE